MTEKLRGYASDILPLADFLLLKQDYVKEKLGDEALFEACKEGTCVGDLIAMVQADFGARCDDEAGTISTFSESVKDLAAMEAVIKILPEIAPPSPAGGAVYSRLRCNEIIKSVKISKLRFDELLFFRGELCLN